MFRSFIRGSNISPGNSLFTASYKHAHSHNRWSRRGTVMAILKWKNAQSLPLLRDESTRSPNKSGQRVSLRTFLPLFSPTPCSRRAANRATPSTSVFTPGLLPFVGYRVNRHILRFIAAT